MTEEWISAYEALKMVAAATSASTAIRAICTRAHDGLIVAKAVKFLTHKAVFDDALLPNNFWWACGESALTQNWYAGDFETWIDHKYHLRAYGVSFSESGILALIGPALSSRGPIETPSPVKAGGRPAAAWWDDLWIELCRQIYVGDLQPTKQSDIETAMMNWTAAHGQNAAESTIRIRARKLWTALSAEDEN